MRGGGSNPASFFVYRVGRRSSQTSLGCPCKKERPNGTPCIKDVLGNHSGQRYGPRAHFTATRWDLNSTKAEWEAFWSTRPAAPILWFTLQNLPEPTRQTPWSGTVARTLKPSLTICGPKA